MAELSAEVLRVCPFCGGEALLEDVSNFLGASRWQAVCQNETCALNEKVPTQAEAIAAWNTRANEPTAALDGGTIEACAKVADGNRTDDDSMWDRAADTIAKAIRALAQTQPQSAGTSGEGERDG